MGGIIGLDWSVLIRMADDRLIETDEFFYKALRAYESVMAEEINRDMQNG